MHLEDATAKRSTALWKTLGKLRKLHSVAVSDYFNRSEDYNSDRGFFFQSVSLNSHIR